MRCGFAKHFASPALHRPYDTEQHTRSDARPTAMLLPGLSLEVLLWIDLMTRQRVQGQAIALIFVPPAGSWQGKAPNDGFIFVEQDEVALLCLLLKVGQLDAGLSQFMRIGVEPFWWISDPLCTRRYSPCHDHVPHFRLNVATRSSNGSERDEPRPSSTRSLV